MRLRRRAAAAAAAAVLAITLGTGVAVAQRDDKPPKGALTDEQLKAHDNPPIAKQEDRRPQGESPSPHRDHGDPVCFETKGRGGEITSMSGRVTRIPATSGGVEVSGACVVE